MLAGGGYDLGLLLDGDADRAGAADERGTFIHQLQVTGLLMYYLAEHRGWRDPVVVSVNNTSMAARLGEHYGIATHETPVGFKFIGPKMIETGAMMGAEESGGFGFGMHLPERDGDLRRPAAARPVPARAGGRSLAGVAGDRAVPRDRRPVVLPADRRPLRPRRRTPRRSAACWSTCASRRRPSSPASPSPGRCRSTPNDGFKFWVADGSWLLVRASGTEPLVRVYTEATSEATPRGDARGRRAAGPRHMTRGRARRPRRRVDKPWGHELIWAHTDRYVGKILVIETGKRLSLQRHQVKDESILVSSGRLRLHLEDDERRRSASRSSAPGEHRHVPTGRIHRYEAIERCELIEVSTPELDDVVRLEDDFGREGTSAP